MRFSEISDAGKEDEENEGSLIEIPVDTDPSFLRLDDDEVIYIWKLDVGEKDRKVPLNEVKGNVKLHLVAQYYYRYDPPRTSSTGSAQTPQGDHHLFKGNVEIAAWNDSGKARHGFEPGTKIPNKALRHLKQQFGDVSIPPDGILEQLDRRFHSGNNLFEVKLS